MARGIPPELLLLIFRFACLSNNSSISLTAVRISHVCHTWRRLAISSQSLWSNITYHSTFGYQGNYVGLQKLMTYLARSGVQPLTLELYIANPDDEGFQIVCEQCSRWNNVHLHCYPNIFPLMNQRLRKLHLPNLQSFIVKDIPFTQENDDYTAPVPPRDASLHWGIFSSGTPKLTHLDLRNSAVYWMRPAHLETLTTIHFNSTFNDLELTPKEIHDILTIPNLTALTILTELWEIIPDIGQISTERVVMPKLRCLGIHGQYGCDIDVIRILATVSCPALEVLVLQNVIGTNLDEGPDDIGARPVELFRNLRTLYLLDNFEVSHTLHPVLASVCRTIEEIVIDTGVSESSAIGSLLLPSKEDGMLPERPPLLFPDFTTLTVRSVDKRDAQNLISILPGLAEQGKPIKKVVLGPQIAEMWIESGHVDGLHDMGAELWREDEVDPDTPLWKTPPQTLIKGFEPTENADNTEHTR